MNPLTRQGGAIQPINYAIPATADANGNATFTFDAVALSNTWTLTLNCAFAPDTARFTAATGASNFGQFKGGNSWGPIQLQGGDRLQVTATGLVAGTQYQMTGQGSCETVADPSIVYPSPYADTVTTSTEQLYLGQGVVSTTTGGVYKTSFVVPINAAYRSLWIAVKDSTYLIPNITVTGIQSGWVYNAINVPYSSNNNDNFWRVPIINGLDTSVTIALNDGTNAFSYWFGADLANVDQAIYSDSIYGISVTNGYNTALNETYPLDVVNYGGESSLSVTTTSTTKTILIPSSATQSYIRIHSIAMDYTGTPATTPVQAAFSVGTGSPLVVLNYPYQTTIAVNGLLYAQAFNLYVTNSTTTSTTFTVCYDVVTAPSIS